MNSDTEKKGNMGGMNAAVAAGIASTPYGPRDPEHKSRQAAIRLIEGAVNGVKKRK